MGIPHSRLLDVRRRGVSLEVRYLYVSVLWPNSGLHELEKHVHGLRPRDNSLSFAAQFSADRRVPKSARGDSKRVCVYILPHSSCCILTDAMLQVLKALVFQPNEIDGVQKVAAAVVLHDSDALDRADIAPLPFLVGRERKKSVNTYRILFRTSLP